MADENGDKTEKASPRQKQKARERGDMVHSRELTSAIGMGAGVLAIGMVTERFAMGWRAAYVHVLDLGSHQDMSLQDGAVINDMVRASVYQTAFPVMIVLAAILAVALMVGMAQSGGLQFHGESIQPKFDRLSPATNLKNLFLSARIDAAAQVIDPGNGGDDPGMEYSAAHRPLVAGAVAGAIAAVV